MVEHFADGIDVCSGGKLECGVCVAETMECNSLGDSSRQKPFFQRGLSHGAVETFEYNPFATFTTEFQHFIAERVNRLFLCLLNAYEHSQLTVSIGSYVFPAELEDVAYSQSGKD